MSMLRKLLKAARLLQSPYARQGLFHGVAATIEHQQALSQFDFSTIVDIGANNGQFALFCLDTFPHAKIISFEPLKEEADKFRSTIGRHLRVTLHETAIGPRAEKVPIHISKRRDSSSLLPIGKQSEVFKGTEEIGTRLIQMAPLDSFITDVTPPALLKIDVQGFELKVLQSCNLDLFDNIYVECSFVELYEGQALADDVTRHLEKNGFICSETYNCYSIKGRPIQADCLFSRANPQTSN